MTRVRRSNRLKEHSSEAIRATPTEQERDTSRGTLRCVAVSSLSPEGFDPSRILMSERQGQRHA